MRPSSRCRWRPRLLRLRLLQHQRRRLYQSPSLLCRLQRLCLQLHLQLRLCLRRGKLLRLPSLRRSRRVRPRRPRRLP